MQFHGHLRRTTEQMPSQKAGSVGFRLWGLFVYDFRADGGDGNIGVAHAQLKGLTVGGIEPEGAVFVVGTPHNGNQLAAAGEEALAALDEIGGVIDVVHGENHID